MLRWRLLLGAVLISALVGAFWLDGELETPGMVLFPIALVLALAPTTSSVPP
jgi:hypothetical protein